MSSPTTLVIFGVSGDLAARKILPALYWLTAAKKLPEQFNVIGVARSDISSQSLVASMAEHINNADDKVLREMIDMISVARMDSKDVDDYQPLREAFERIEQGASGATRLLHCSIPPAVAFPVIEALKTVGLLDTEGITTRLLLEKPFGFDLEAAKKLESQLQQMVRPDQLYRIDHYLAKKDVQALLHLHFSDPAMAGRWNSQHIQRIEIEASETIGIEGRADFYEQTGALRDVIQSHMLALMALTLMTNPAEKTAAAFCAERASVLESVESIAPDKVDQQALRGQYEGYRSEVINNDSITETYAALKLFVDTPQWQGMPVVVAGGKAVDAARSEIRVHFKDPSHGGETPLIIPIMSADKTELDRLPDGYERVLLDAIAGDQTNTTSGAEVVASWTILDPVLKRWARDGDGLIQYSRGAKPPAFSQ